MMQCGREKRRDRDPSKHAGENPHRVEPNPPISALRIYRNPLAIFEIRAVDRLQRHCIRSVPGYKGGRHEVTCAHCRGCQPESVRSAISFRCPDTVAIRWSDIVGEARRLRSDSGLHKPRCLSLCLIQIIDQHHWSERHQYYQRPSILLEMPVESSPPVNLGSIE